MFVNKRPSKNNGSRGDNGIIFNICGASPGQLKTINITVTEVLNPGRLRCSHVCIDVRWNEVTICDDYRNVLFYTISYREA